MVLCAYDLIPLFQFTSSLWTLPEDKWMQFKPDASRTRRRWIIRIINTKYIHNFQIVSPVSIWDITHLTPESHP